MDKITKILLVIAVILIVIWASMTFIINSNFNFSNFNQNNPENNNLNNFNGHNATIKILSGSALTKNEKIIVQLFDNNNQPITNKYLSCRFFNSSSSGNSYTAYTNDNGIAEFSLDYLSPGFYGIEIEYKSYDGNIGSCIIQDNIEIKN